MQWKVIGGNAELVEDVGRPADQLEDLGRPADQLEDLAEVLELVEDVAVGLVEGALLGAGPVAEGKGVSQCA